MLILSLLLAAVGLFLSQRWLARHLCGACLLLQSGLLRSLSHYFFPFAVLAARLKFAAVGAPLVPGLRIFSLEPALMRLLFA